MYTIGRIPKHPERINELPEWFAKLYDLLASAAHSKHITTEMRDKFNKPEIKAGIAAIEAALIDPKDGGSAAFKELSE